MVSVALAAEYLGHSAVDLAAVLPPNFMQVRSFASTLFF
jgi:hypothetical protein